ncbi:MAG: DUF2807 domain-containing protein [Bacteroidales bacterium]|nr:DUF2807 domain-containing protein [Bacteroidales bacterium]
MKLQNLILGFLTMGLLAGCTDNGNRITKTYGLTDFDALNVSHAFEVEVMPSDKESVELVVSSKLEKYLVVEKKGSTLYIGLKDSYNFRWFDINPCLKAYVSLKDLRRVTASGASDVALKSAYDALGQNLDIALSGASSLDGRVLNVDRLTVEVSGASKLALEGNGTDMGLDVSGASKTDLDEFPVKGFQGEASGASRAKLYVTETFSGCASGASNIEVEGRPQVLKAEESGASHIRFK